MFARVYTILLPFFLAHLAAAAEWNDLKVIQINRLPPHATMMVYPDRYAIETSSDSKSWSRAVDKTKNATSASVTEDALDATARYVRVTIEGAPAEAWASIFEVEVY